MANGTKKNATTAAAAASTATATTAAKAISNSLMKRFERLSAMIDDSLESETLMPAGLCTSIAGSDSCTGDDHHQRGGHGGGGFNNNNNTTADTTHDTTFNSLPGGGGQNDENETIAAQQKEGDGRNVLRLDETNGNFASWLASQEFDASAIVWNGDDNNPQDLSGELETASAIGRSCEYSPDEFLDIDDEDRRHRQQHQQRRGGNNIVGDDDDDGYVSIADTVKRSKWQAMVPPQVSDVWNTVVSAPMQCFQPTSTMLSEAKTKLSKDSSRVSSRSSNKFRNEKQRQQQMAGGAGVGDTFAQQHAAINNKDAKVADENLPSIFRAKPVGAGGGTKKLPPGILKKNSSYSLGSKPDKKKKPSKQDKDGGTKTISRTDDAEDKKQSTKEKEDDEADKLIEKVQKSRMASSSTSTSNKHDNMETLSQVSGPTSHVSSSIAQLTKFPTLTDQSSVATPLVGEDLLLEDHFVPVVTTPHRTDTSCTYSDSPPIHRIPDKDQDSNNRNTNLMTSAPHPHSEDVHVVSPSGTPNKDSFSFNAVQLPQEEDENSQDEDDDDETPLMNELTSSSLNNSYDKKMKKVKGRRRRRMRLTKT